MMLHNEEDFEACGPLTLVAFTPHHHQGTLIVLTQSRIDSPGRNDHRGKPSSLSLLNTMLSALFPVRVTTGCVGGCGLTLDLTLHSPEIQFSSPVH